MPALDEFPAEGALPDSDQLPAVARDTHLPFLERGLPRQFTDELSRFLGITDSLSAAQKSPAFTDADVAGAPRSPEAAIRHMMRTGAMYGPGETPRTPLDLAMAFVGGKPIRGFHGSPLTDLTTIKPGERGPFGPASYFSPHEGVSQRYAGEKGKLYAKDLPDIFNGMGSRYLDPNVSSYEVWREQIGRLAKANPDHAPQIEELGKKFDPQDGYPFFWELSRLAKSQEGAQEMLRRAGFKGISGHVDGPEIAYFGEVRIAKEAEQGKPSLFHGGITAEDMNLAGEAEKLRLRLRQLDYDRRLRGGRLDDPDYAPYKRERDELRRRLKELGE